MSGKASGRLRRARASGLRLGPGLDGLDRQEIGDPGVTDDPADHLDREVADGVAEDRFDVALSEAAGRVGEMVGRQAVAGRAGFAPNLEESS